MFEVKDLSPSVNQIGSVKDSKTRENVMITTDHNTNWGRADLPMVTAKLQTLRHKSTLPSENKNSAHSAQNDVKSIQFVGLMQKKAW